MLIFSIVGLLLLLSAAARAVADSIAHHNSFKSRGQWWDSDVSWQWKYKDNPWNTTPKFWGSTTIFVAFTDAWHFFCMLRDTSWQLALALVLYLAIPSAAAIWIAIGFFFVGKGIYSGVFEMLYSIFNKQ